jgi:hypothetical protein
MYFSLDMLSPSGYIDAPPGERQRPARPHFCGGDHFTAMVLTEIEGDRVYACPEESCYAIKPFGVDTPFTLHPTEPSPNRSGTATWSDFDQSTVRGLPLDQHAWIKREDRGWRIRESTDGIQSDWPGDYSSLTDAFRAIAAGLRRPLVASSAK